jgi:hypothetical protein
MPLRPQAMYSKWGVAPRSDPRQMMASYLRTDHFLAHKDLEGPGPLCVIFSACPHAGRGIQPPS